jgi:hypothetical protein
VDDTQSNIRIIKTNHDFVNFEGRSKNNERLLNIIRMKKKTENLHNNLNNPIDLPSN